MEGTIEVKNLVRLLERLFLHKQSSCFSPGQDTQVQEPESHVSGTVISTLNDTLNKIGFLTLRL